MIWVEDLLCREEWSHGSQCRVAKSQIPRDCPHTSSLGTSFSRAKSWMERGRQSPALLKALVFRRKITLFWSTGKMLGKGASLFFTIPYLKRSKEFISTINTQEDHKALYFRLSGWRFNHLLRNHMKDKERKVELDLPGLYPGNASKEMTLNGKLLQLAGWGLDTRNGKELSPQTFAPSDILPTLSANTLAKVKSFW